MSEEFSAGVKILLQRMETNPEEFYEEGSKTRVANPRWANLLSLVVTSKLKGEPISDTIYLDPAEIDALYEGYKKIRRKAFDDQIMRTVLAPEEELSSSATPINPHEGALRYNIKTGMEEYYLAGTWFPVNNKAVLIGGGGGSGYDNSSYVGGGGGGGSVTVKTPTGTHTFTKSGTFTGTGDEYYNP